MKVFFFVLAVAAFIAADSVHAQQLTTKTWPRGTLVSHFEDGGRVNTFHNGYLYLGASTRTSVYDIRNPDRPTIANRWDVGINGHLWWKMGNLFSRHYVNPEIQASGYKYSDLSAMPKITPWTGAAPVPLRGIPDLNFFPYIYYSFDNHKVLDQRSGQEVARFNFIGQNGFTGGTALRIGNLLFWVAETPNTGVVVYDVGTPSNIRLLDMLPGVTQYTTYYAVWRNYLVLAVGQNINAGGKSLIAIDYSDPTNLSVAFGFPTESVGAGRYIFFQDEFGFMAKFNRAVRVNMEQRTVEPLPLNFKLPPGESLDDFQVLPLGHLLVISGSEGADDDTFIITHQDGLDKKRPYVGYHLPVAGAANQPRTTTVGLVINETLDDQTVVPENIQIRAVVNGLPSGAPLPVDVVSSQHSVVNVTPTTPLAADTTYQVRVVGNGIHDVAGNGIQELAFLFSTGTLAASSIGPQITTLARSGRQPIEDQRATFNATATHPLAAVEYRWQFGDNSVWSVWGPSSRATHVYSNPGQYKLVLQARALGTDGHYYTTGRALNVVVGSRFTPPTRDLRSTSIIVDRTARRVWSVNPDSKSVAILDADKANLIREIAVGERPSSVTLDSQDRAWVSCRDSDEIYVVTSSGSVVRRLALARGSRPTGMLASADGAQIYVAEYATGRVRRFDAATFAQTGVVNVGPTPESMTLTTSGLLLVTRFISGSGEGQVYSVHSASMTAAAPIRLALDSTSIENGSSARGVPNYVRGLAAPPGDERVWYVAKKDNVLRGQMRDGNRLTHETTVRPLVGRVDPLTGTESVAERLDVDNTSLPAAIAFSPSGAHAFVAFEGNNRVTVLNVATGEKIVEAGVGFAPEGLAIDPTTKRVFVQNLLGRSVTVLAGDQVMNHGDPALPVLATVGTVATELMSAQVLRGKQVFYDAADARMGLEGYMSCATCHLDGGSDGRIWDFTDQGEGLRRTIILRGRGGLNHGMVHWSGNFDEIQDFEIPIRGTFGGTGFIPTTHFNSNPLAAPNAGRSSDLDALAAYLGSLTEFAPSPFRQTDGNLTAAGMRGRSIFRRQNCADCHGGAAFTDSPRAALHDVGTLTARTGSRLGSTLAGLDTPTLLGLWENAAFLHDGSASRLEDVLTHTGGAAHGGMNQLSASERSDLAAYLLQIDSSEPAL